MLPYAEPQAKLGHPYMKIAIIGYGVEGRSLAEYFRKRGERDITVCDMKAPGVKKKIPGVAFRFGPHYLENLKEFDIIFRSPGIPYLSREFTPVRSRLSSLTKYFFEYCPCPIVGVTGTKGKGTTASLLFEMMKRMALPNGGRVFLAGNIGQPPLAFLDDLTPHDVVILELSSFQLQDLTKSPHIAIVLGITPDHLDHHENLEEYIDAKRSIVRFQGPEDQAIYDADNAISASFAKATKARVTWVSTENSVEEGGFLKLGKCFIKEGKTALMVGERGRTKLIGIHNIKNILAAACAAHALGAPIEIISQVIETFPGLPHRLECIREIRGIRYFNDSASTNPETTVAALRALATAPLICIAGGSDKNADFAPLGEEIVRQKNVKSVILMGPTKGKIEQAIRAAAACHPRPDAPLELITAESYHEAFLVAQTLAQPGDTVLLSPACASFDSFKNYQERGDIFRSFVLNGLEGST